MGLDIWVNGFAFLCLDGSSQMGQDFGLDGGGLVWMLDPIQMGYWAVFAFLYFYIFLIFLIFLYFFNRLF